MSPPKTNLAAELAQAGLQSEEHLTNEDQAPDCGNRMERLFAARTHLLRPSAIRESLKLAAQPDVISFAGGLPAPELFPLDRVKAAVDRTFSRIGPTALQYSESEGIAALRDWIASRVSSDGRTVTRDNILITAGAQQALDLIGRLFLDEGNAAIVENPTYLALLSSWRPLGVRFLPASCDFNGINPEDVEAFLKRNPKLAYLCPNFQNPQGTTLSLERRERLVELALTANLPIIEDDPYGALRYEGEPLPSLWSLGVRANAAANPQRRSSSPIIHVGSFSKVLMPGLRLGWIVAPEPVINKLVLAKQAADLHTSTLNQYLALELLNANYLEDIVPKLIQAYKARRDTMLAALERCFPSIVKWTRPGGGMFLFVTLPQHLNAASLLPRALERKVAYVPGAEFHVDGSGNNTLRLNFSNASPERITEGIARLAAVFDEAQRTP